LSNNNDLSLGQKSKLPIVNIRQLSVFNIMVIITIITALYPLLIGEKVNLPFIMVDICLTIFSYLSIMFLRSTAPKLVQDTSLSSTFKIFFQQLSDAFFKQKNNPVEFMNLFEKIIVWSIRGWDLSNQDQLRDAIEYWNKNMDNLLK